MGRQQPPKPVPLHTRTRTHTHTPMFSAKGCAVLRCNAPLHRHRTRGQRPVPLVVELRRGVVCRAPPSTATPSSASVKVHSAVVVIIVVILAPLTPLVDRLAQKAGGVAVGPAQTEADQNATGLNGSATYNCWNLASLPPDPHLLHSSQLRTSTQCVSVCTRTCERPPAPAGAPQRTGGPGCCPCCWRRRPCYRPLRRRPPHWACCAAAP